MTHTACHLTLDGVDVFERNGNIVGYYFAHPEGGRIGQVFVNCLVTTPEEALANAKRIIACWNRLQSFTTDELESGKPGFLQLIQQKKDLLEVVEAGLSAHQLLVNREAEQAYLMMQRFARMAKATLLTMEALC